MKQDVNTQKAKFNKLYKEMAEIVNTFDGHNRDLAMQGLSSCDLWANSYFTKEGANDGTREETIQRSAD